MPAAIGRWFAALCLCLGGHIALAADARVKSLTLDTRPPYHYDFSKLEKGAGVPVCEAYLRRLRATAFRTLPHCDRPENDSIPGFRVLKRVPLTTAETLKLLPPIEAWLFLGDPDLSNGTRDMGAQFAAERQARVVENKGHVDPPPSPYYYRFEPRIDIDNDGVADDVIVWKESGMPCADRSHDPPLMFTGTYLVVLNNRGELDYARTRDLLEWPNPLSKVKPTLKGPVTFMAHTFGVFMFEGAYYIDAFFSNEDKEATGVLGVFQHMGRQVADRCEIRWYDRSPR